MPRGPTTTTIDAVATHNLGDVDPGFVGRWAVQFKSSSFVGSVTIKARVPRSGMDAVAVAYIDFADGTIKTAALAGDALVLIDCSGLELILDCTAYTSGSLAVAALPLIG
jgi:hypothetical protein